MLSLVKKQNVESKKNDFKNIKPVDPDFITDKDKLNFLDNIFTKYIEEQTKLLWTVDEINIDYADIKCFFSLPKQSQDLIKAIILFFTQADKLVINNIDSLKEVPYEKAKNFYNLQTYVEDIHDQVYMKIAKLYYQVDNSKENEEILNNDVALLDLIIKTSSLTDEVFDLNEYECEYFNQKNETEKKIFYAVTKKINLINKWRNVKSRVHNLVAFFSIESLAFNTLFTIIRLFKNNNLGLKYIVDVNEFVEKDEKIHALYGIDLNKYFVQNKLPLEEVGKIIKEIAEVEKEFILSLIPQRFETYCIEDFINFIEHQANVLFSSVDIEKTDVKIYENVQPICQEFIIHSTLSAKGNFFERPSAYETTNKHFKNEDIQNLFV